MALVEPSLAGVLELKPSSAEISSFTTSRYNSRLLAIKEVIDIVGLNGSILIHLQPYCTWWVQCWELELSLVTRRRIKFEVDLE
ncbi:hypothetical protein CMV_022910 [Castanea mollissima]|uniref:Uncharacterized protein n=1 Tax=Castanea mollissima TaxID=60419 RepID=A0A8J4V7I5_9ROSI|nr:hypothetical protein CMV_022910 [Castanea mollissima]